MTAPLSLPPSCVLYVDGVRYNDGQIGESPFDPVALDDLRITWGRNNSLDQPTPSTLTFHVLDAAGGQRFLDKLHIGARVDVTAEATIYPDPTESTIPELLPGPSAWLTISGSTSVQTILSPSMIGMTGGWVFYPPAAYSSDPSAWDELPRTLAGQSWRLTAEVAFPPAFAGWDGWSVTINPVGYVTPAGVTGFVELPGVTLRPGETTMDLTFVPPAGVWLGLILRFGATGPTWEQLDGTSWLDEPTGQSWDAIETFELSGVAMLAPAAGALRAGSVVSGRITDLTAQYDEGKGATLVDVIVQSHLAELGNRYVGDAPWTVEPLGSRFAKIVAASGQAIQYVVDPSVAGVPVTWRDVDKQPAAGLLQELAKSVGGALWSAASLVTGPYLWLEDIDQRPSMYVLVEGPDGIVRIVLRTSVESLNVIEIDACDVLLDPVQWTQTTEDNSTRVVVTWQLQGVDDKGQPKVTATDELAVDEQREIATGQRRIQVTTELSQQTDAAHVANAMLGRVVTPGWRVSGLTIELAYEPLDARMLGNVMAILDGSTRVGLGILLTNLPSWSPVGTRQIGLFLEGGRFTNADGAWTLELLTSAADAQGKASVAWNELPGPVTPIATRTNRATNPRAVQSGAGNWTTLRDFGAGGAGTYTYATFGTPIPGAPGVSTLTRKTWTTATPSAAGWFVQQDAATRFPIVAGRSYTASVYVRQTAGGNRSCYVMMGFVNAAGALVPDWQVGPAVSVPTGTGWTRISATFVAPATTVALTLVVDCSGAFGVGATFDATALLLEESATVRGYFDGSTADVAPIDNAWTGTANASTSTATDTTPADTGWRWIDFEPSIAWNDLAGVSYP